jgi:hypothetical protein
LGGTKTTRQAYAASGEEKIDGTHQSTKAGPDSFWGVLRIYSVLLAQESQQKQVLALAQGTDLERICEGLPRKPEACDGLIPRESFTYAEASAVRPGHVGNWPDN